MVKSAGTRVCGASIAEIRVIGSIPEKEEKTDSIYNCATTYDPQGVFLHSDQRRRVTKLMQQGGHRQDGRQAPESPSLRYRYPGQADFQGWTSRAIKTVELDKLMMTCPSSKGIRHAYGWEPSDEL